MLLRHQLIIINAAPPPADYSKCCSSRCHTHKQLLALTVHVQQPEKHLGTAVKLPEIAVEFLETAVESEVA